MKKKIIVIFTLSMLIGSNGFCQDIYYINEGKIEYKGKTENAQSNVVLNLLKKDETFDEEEWVNADASGIYYYGNTDSDSEGVYNFSLFIDEPGLYKAEVFCNENKNSDNLIYVNSKAFTEYITLIKEKKSDVFALEEILKTKRTELGLWFDLYESADFIQVAKILSQSTIPDTAELDKIHMLEKCFVVNALNDKKISDLKNYKEVLSQEEKILIEFWMDEHSDEIAERISGRNYASCEDMNKDLKEAIALVKIKYADGFGEAKEVVEYFLEEIGISGISDTKARNIMGKDYSDFQSLKKAINNTPSGGNSSGSSGGGGGGTSSKGTSINIGTTEYNKIPEKTTVEKRKRFKDLDGYQWVSEEIEELAELGIINGRTFDTFAPSENITREEFVALIVNTFHIQVDGDEPGFLDVTEDKWYYETVKKAYNSGIIRGISETEFGSGKNITRQDLAVIVYKVLKLCNVDFGTPGSVTGFGDDSDISEYARESVWALKNKQIMIGNNNMFNPKSYTTRAEAAKVIYGLIDYSKGGLGE